MDVNDVVASMIIGFPNFAGLLICIAFQWQQNRKLIELLSDCYEDKERNELLKKASTINKTEA